MSVQPASPPESLPDFVLTESVLGALVTVAATGNRQQGAGFFVSGPFGSGKTSLLQALATLADTRGVAPQWKIEATSYRSTSAAEPVNRALAPEQQADFVRQVFQKLHVARCYVDLGALRDDPLSVVLSRAVEEKYPGILLPTGNLPTSIETIDAGLLANNYDMLLLLVDELSPFMKKKDLAAAPQDALFLLQLGKALTGHRVILVFSVMEDVPALQELAPGDLAALRQSYQMLPLHIDGSLAGRLLPQFTAQDLKISPAQPYQQRLVQAIELYDRAGIQHPEQQPLQEARLQAAKLLEEVENISQAARRAWVKHDYQEAAYLNERLLFLDPDNSQAIQKLERAGQIQGLLNAARAARERRDEAIRALPFLLEAAHLDPANDELRTEAIDLYEKEVHALVTEVELLLERSELRAAIVVCERTLEWPFRRLPDEQASLFLRAMDHLLTALERLINDDYGKKRSLLSQVSSLSPDHLYAPEDDIREFAQIRNEILRFPDLLLEADAARHKQDYPRALRLYRKALDLEPLFNRIPKLMGNLQANQMIGFAREAEHHGDCSRAITFYERALSFNPDSRDAQYGVERNADLIKHWQNLQRELEQAEKLARAALASGQDLGDSLHAYESILHSYPSIGSEMLTRTRQGIEHLEKALAIRDSLASAERAMRNGDMNQAVDIYRHALAVDSSFRNQPSALELAPRLGRHLQSQATEAEARGDRDRARELCRNALFIHPPLRESPQMVKLAKRLAGDVLSEAGEADRAEQYAQAITLYEEVLFFDPGRTEVRQDVERLERKLKVQNALHSAEEAERAANYEQAIGLYEQALSDDPSLDAVRFRLDELATRREALDLVQQALAAVGRQQPDDAISLYAQAVRLFSPIQETRLAEELAQKLARYLRSQAEKAEQEHEYTKAIDWYEKGLFLVFPLDEVQKAMDHLNYRVQVQRLVRLAVQAIRCGHHHEALDLYRQALSRDSAAGELPEAAELTVNLALHLKTEAEGRECESDYVAAARLYQEALALAPSLPDVQQKVEYLTGNREEPVYRLAELLEKRCSASMLDGYCIMKGITGKTRTSRILELSVVGDPITIVTDLFNVGEITCLAQGIGVGIESGASAEQVREAVLRSIGFQIPKKPTGIAVRRETLERLKRRLNIANEQKPEIVSIALEAYSEIGERVLKELIGFYCTVVMGVEYEQSLLQLGLLRQKGRSGVQAMTFGQKVSLVERLNQHFQTNVQAQETMRAWFDRTWVLEGTRHIRECLRLVVGYRNRLAHPSEERETRVLGQETSQALDLLVQLFEELEAECIYPPVIVVEGERRDKYGRRTYDCVDDHGKPERVFTPEKLMLGQEYFLYPVTNPIRVNPLIVPKQ